MLNHAMDRCLPCGPVDTHRARFLYLWRHRLSSVRAMHAVTRLLDDPVTGPNAREWIIQACADMRSERELEVLKQGRLRASMGAASLLLVRACEVEGIPLAAVAHGILPRVHHLGDSEGFPWRGQEEHVPFAELDGTKPKIAYPRFFSRFYTDSAIVRPQEHPSGGWGVRLKRGVLLPSMLLGGCRLMSTSDGRGVIDIPGVFPDTLLCALPGRRVVEAVGHAVFEDARFVIRSARVVRGRTRITFSCPLEPIEFDRLLPPAGQEHHQLGRDGRLSGIDAVRDVLGRRSSAPFLRLGPKRLAGALEVDYLEGIELDRLWRINMMAPPWAERLHLDCGTDGSPQLFTRYSDRFPWDP